MDTRLLETFLAVVDSGSMADAAAILGCSAAAVSQQMGRLERELGTTLLERSKQGTVVTHAGSQLLPRARAVIGAERDLRTAATSASTAVRLASFSSASVNLLPGVVAGFRSAHPGATLNVTEVEDDSVPFDAVLDGTVDLAITYEYDHVPVQVPEGVHVQSLGYDEHVLVVPASHPLARRRTTRLIDLADEPWVLFPPTDMATRSIVATTSAAGFVPDVLFAVRDYQVVRSLVAAGLGISLLASMVIPELDPDRVVVRRLSGGAPGRRIFLARRQGPALPAASMVWDLLVDAWASSR